jgi:glycosyltransferase involved in cell wall biosynthesis
MPVRNGAQFLPKILSVLVSNLQPQDEVIIIDDNSTDQTLKMLLDFQELMASSNVRILENSGRGLVDALNLGFKEATNLWVARFDVDDEYPSDRIKVQRSYMDPSISVIFSDYRLESESGLDLGYIPSAIFSTSTAVSLLASNRTPHSSALVNKQSFLLAGGYKAQDFPAEDLGLWLRMSSFGNIISIPRSLLNYRVSRYSVTSLKRKEMRKKRFYVLSEYRFKDEVVQQFSKSFLSNIKEYEKFDYALERQILTIKDFWLLKRFGYRPRNFVFFITLAFLKMFFNFKTSKALFQLIKFKIFRKLARRSFLPTR